MNCVYPAVQRKLHDVECIPVLRQRMELSLPDHYSMTMQQFTGDPLTLKKLHRLPKRRKFSII
jgi:hypothetical protein